MAWDVRGKTILITGTTSGIGLEASLALARRGARVVMVGRDRARTEAAVAKVRAGSGSTEITHLLCDFSSLAAVRELAGAAHARCPRLDVLVNNAGGVSKVRRLTENGIERTFAVNHLAPFLLTGLILDRLKAQAPSRIITTASDAHHGATIPFDDLDAEKTYQGFARYKQSKLANILFTRELARRLEGSDTVCSCFHPGLVASGFNRNNGPWMSLAMTMLRPVARSVEKGAETLVWLASTAKVNGLHGGYFVDMERRQPSPQALDPQTARRLWEASERQCGRHWPR